LIIRRVIAEGARSRVSINDNAVTVQKLTRLGAALVQVYGQHEQQSLLERENHEAILDRHAGLEGELDEYRSLFQRACEARRRLAELERREAERANLLELARFRANELQDAQLVVGEDEELAANRVVLANAAKLSETAHAVEQILHGDDNAAIDAIARVQSRLEEASTLDPKLGEPLELVAAAKANIEEAAYSLQAYAARSEADPARLEQIDARLVELNRLKRKYGGTIEAALETLARANQEITELEDVAEQRTGTAAELEDALEQLLGTAKKISAHRLKDSMELKRRMEAELKALGMRSAVFEARLGRINNHEGAFVRDGYVLGETGFDTVEFYLAPNLGQPPMPLAKIASGGELSRVMLSLKQLEARRRGLSTMIFDEVDAGIGGGVAEILGRKLKQLARFHQILCVTHLAQIAAFADSHFVVEKRELRGSTRSLVTTLDAESRTQEIARMIGGNASNEKFLRAARELRERAQT